jgi:hypothetical protein
VQHDGARANATYYFRLVDATNGSPVLASSSYPSLVTEGGSLSFSISGVPTGSTTEGVTTDIETTPTAIPFGTMPFDNQFEAAYRLTVDTNATEGYRMLMFATQDLTDTYGNTISLAAGTNESPVSWSTGCPEEAAGCYGYHVGDDSLTDGSTRFAPNDTFAAVATTTPVEVMYSAQPSVNESSDLIFRLEVSNQQPAGDYQQELIFISVPVF